EGNVDVVAEPHAERHVPAPPELRRVARQPWPVEVLGHDAPAAAGETDPDVGPSGEDEIEPDVEPDRPGPEARRALEAGEREAARPARLEERLHDDELGDAARDAAEPGQQR